MDRTELRKQAMEELRATREPMILFGAWAAGVISDAQTYLRMTIDMIEQREVEILQRQEWNKDEHEEALGVGA